MLGAYFGQMSAKRSREQLGKDVESLREIADKSLSTDEPMTPDDYANRLSKLYAHHGVRRDEGFQTDVGLFADKVGKRQSAAFAKQLYPDRPFPELGSVTGPEGGWPTALTGDKANQFRDIRSRLALEGWENDTKATGDFNREQKQKRALMSQFSPPQQLNYFTSQKASEEKNKYGWAKLYEDQLKREEDLKLAQQKADDLAAFQEGTLAEREKQRLSNAVSKVSDRINAERIANIRADAMTTAAKTRAAAAKKARKPSTAEINLGIILDAISNGKMPEMPMEDILIQSGVMKGKTPPGLREALGNVVYLEDFQAADLDGKIEIIKGIVDSFNPQSESAPVDAMQWLDMNPDATPGY